MRMVWWIALLAGMTSWAARPQEDAVSLDDVMKSADQWASENLDQDALRVLRSTDQQMVKQLFADIQKQFHGEYVIDLAALRDAVNAALPILESYDETLPYAVWLRARLDYLDVAEQFRLNIPPLKPEPGQPPKTAPNPPPEKEREIWITNLAARPWPKNAKAYVTQLKPVFAAQTVPPELVWIAEVESGFDPRARSPAGAAGLFQLEPATAKHYGLRTWAFDQRFKPEQSAGAAAQYLHQLHNRFKDWRLALAAYNAGEGTVQRLLTRHKTQTFDGISQYLPAETQMFVPKVEATILRREGVKLAQL